MADPRECPHCSDGHANPRSRPWGVYVGPERDGDGQPTTLHVGPSNGAHVAESDAEWLWNMIRGDSATAAQIIDEILAPLRAQIGVAEYEAGQATERAEQAGEECGAVRRQLTAARMEASGLRREAEALAGQRDHALARERAQYDLTVAHVGMREQAEAAIARVRMALADAEHQTYTCLICGDDHIEAVRAALDQEADHG